MMRRSLRTYVPMQRPIEDAPSLAREPFHSPWMDTPTAARYLTTASKTLRQWRCLGKGPRYHVVGGRLVRYHVEDLDAFARGKSNR